MKKALLVVVVSLSVVLAGLGAAGAGNNDCAVIPLPNAIEVEEPSDPPVPPRTP